MPAQTKLEGAKKPPRTQTKLGPEPEIHLKPRFMNSDYYGSGKLLNKVAIITGGKARIERATNLDSNDVLLRLYDGPDDPEYEPSKTSPETPTPEQPSPCAPNVGDPLGNPTPMRDPPPSNPEPAPSQPTPMDSRSNESVSY